MERAKRAVESFEKTFNRLKEVVDNPSLMQIFSGEFLVEICIKRFEFTFEALWKASREVLKSMGMECNSPRSRFRELIAEGPLSVEFEPVLAELVKVRNLAVHVYDEKTAEELFNRINSPEVVKTFEACLEALKKTIEGDL
ncbi:MAG: nucleotidyltransferase substrate binding protein [Desulfurobacteriaceae bacterium]